MTDSVNTTNDSPRNTKQKLKKTSLRPVHQKIKKEDGLSSKAVEELLKEARVAKERSKELGTTAWRKKRFTTNKRFLQQTLFGTITANLRSNKSSTNKDSSQQDSSTSTLHSRTDTSPPKNLKRSPDHYSHTEKKLKRKR